MKGIHLFEHRKHRGLPLIGYRISTTFVRDSSSGDAPGGSQKATPEKPS
jgi:hypothetical protein